MTKTDWIFVQQAKKGDSHAFARLYEIYYKDLYHFALYYTKDSITAEDAVSSAVLKAFEQLHKLRKNVRLRRTGTGGRRGGCGAWSVSCYVAQGVCRTGFCVRRRCFVRNLRTGSSYSFRHRYASSTDPMTSAAAPGSDCAKVRFPFFTHA